MTSRGLIFKNLFRKKLRTFLTIFAILVAFAIFGVLGAFQNALTNPPQGASASRLVTTNMISFTQPLPYAYLEKVRAAPNARTVTHMSWFGGYYQEPRNFLIAFAVDPASFVDVYSEYAMSAETRDAFLKNRTAILVSKTLADKYGWKGGDKIPVKSNIFRQKDGSDTWQFDVAGIFTNPDQENDPSVYFNYEYFKESVSFGGDSIGQLVIATKDTTKNDATAQAIDAMFQNSQAETETRSEAAFAQSFTGQLGDIGFLITLIVGAAFITILLIAGNTMMLTVRERTGEIAVLKTIGFTASRIFAMVLSESILMALIGGLIGLGLAYFGAAAVNSMGAFFGGAVKLSGGLVAIAVGLMALLGFLTGFLPAWRAMNTDIVTAFGKK